MTKTDMIVLDIHSVVDLITNSSTVIFTYQHSTNQVKDLVQEILNLMGETSLTPDDVFYYGEFHDPEEYVGWDRQEGVPEEIETADDVREAITRVLRGEIEKPEWLSKPIENWMGYNESISLYLVPKDEKYATLAKKISSVLNSISAEGDRDG